MDGWIWIGWLRKKSSHRAATVAGDGRRRRRCISVGDGDGAPATLGIGEDGDWAQNFTTGMMEVMALSLASWNCSWRRMEWQQRMTLVVLHVFVLREVDDEEQLVSAKPKVSVAPNFISWNSGSHRPESPWRTTFYVDLEYVDVLRQKFKKMAHEVRMTECKSMHQGLAEETH